MACAWAFVAMLAAALPTHGLVPGPWSDRQTTPAERAKLLVANMTLDEKLQMLHGPLQGECCQCTTSPLCAYVGNIAPVQRLGIPPVNMQDGPQGFRANDEHAGTSTAWPAGMTMAATWDPDLLYEWGSGMGREFREKGANVQLGPGLNVARVPRNGRNFEYLSGEDPFLGYTLSQPAVRGIQSQKVVANAKHWVLNNQETGRGYVSEEVDEATRFEMYYPPFKGAIEAGVGSFMCSYNRVNGIWSCENEGTLSGDLKQKLGFTGYVMSDWGATHSASLAQGLDVEQGNGFYMDPNIIKQKLAAGTLTEGTIDESVRRIFLPMFEVGVMDEPLSTWDWSRLSRNVTTQESLASARKLSAASTVLLRNDGGVLPLPRSGRFALIGFFGKGAVVHGGGSGSVVPSHIVSPLEGIHNALGDTAQIDTTDGTDIAKAADMAAKADHVIVFVGTLSHEGGDRKSLSLDDGCETSTKPGDDGQCVGNANQQNALVAAVAKANPRAIVVASVPGAVLMPWSNDVAAILTNFMPGQQAGNAIADVLFGKVNPSAKLPITFPNKEDEVGLSQDQWPGLPDPTKPAYAFYSEKLLVGYRYYDARGINFTTGFPFGHGLSYTGFEYSQLSIEGTLVSFAVKNVGSVAGAEVAQIYLGFPLEAGKPPYQLKGFKKTHNLQAGEATTLKIQLRQEDLSSWDAQKHSWSLTQGAFKVAVGSSSRDIRLRGLLHVQGGHISGSAVENELVV